MTHQDIQYTGDSEVMADKEVYRLLKARNTAFRSADSLRAARVNLSHGIRRAKHRYIKKQKNKTKTSLRDRKGLGVWGKAFRPSSTTNTHQRPFTVTLLYSTTSAPRYPGDIPSCVWSSEMFSTTSSKLL